MAQSIPAHKYKPRTVSAVRSFPKGCGRSAVAAVTPIKSPPSPPISESTTPDTVAFLDSPATAIKSPPPPLVEGSATPVTVTFPDSAPIAAVTPIKSPPPPPVEGSATPGTATFPDSAITPIKSHPVGVNESATPDLVIFLDSELKRDGSFLNPNRFPFPKRRKVSATRTFPAGCGRPKLKNLGKEPESNKMDVDELQEEPQTAVNNPKEQSVKLEIVTHGAITAIPNSCTDIISLEEPKPLNIHESSKRETGIGALQKRHTGMGALQKRDTGMGALQKRHTGMGALQEKKHTQIVKSGIYGATLSKRDTGMGELQEKKHTQIVKSGIYGSTLETKKKKAVIGQDQKRVQESGSKPKLEMSERQEQTKPRAQSGSVVAITSQKQSTAKEEAVGDRLIVQCLMAAPNCPWRVGGLREENKGRSAGKGSIVKQKQPSDAEEARSTIAGSGSIVKLREPGEAEETVGDRLIVQCLMAAPNCPWRSGSKSTTPKFPRSLSKQVR